MLLEWLQCNETVERVRLSFNFHEASAIKIPFFHKHGSLTFRYSYLECGYSLLLNVKSKASFENGDISFSGLYLIVRYITAELLVAPTH